MFLNAACWEMNDDCRYCFGRRPIDADYESTDGHRPTCRYALALKALAALALPPPEVVPSRSMAKRLTAQGQPAIAAQDAPPAERPASAGTAATIAPGPHDGSHWDVPAALPVAPALPETE